MTHLITGERLKKAVEDGTFIKDGDPGSVEAVKYDFHLGDRVLKALYQQPKDILSIPEEDRVVNPGEAVFVLTRERLDLPNNMMAVLTPKRKLAHDGIIIMGGLAVDPLYRGFLLIGLYNISSTPFPLLPGRKIIGAVFSQFSADEFPDVEMPTPTEIKDFPLDLIKLIRDYHPVGVKALQEQIADTRRDLQTLKSDLTSDKDWKENLKIAIDKHTKAVEDHDRQLGDMLKGLEKEQELRAAGDKKIEDKLTGMSNMFFGARMIWLAFVALLMLVIGAIVGPGVQGLMGRMAAANAPATSPPSAPNAHR